MESVSVPLSREKLLLMERFTELYNAPPLDGYVSRFAFSTLGAEDPTAPEGARGEPCILVHLRERLPAGHEIPPEFEGVRVFAKL